MNELPQAIDTGHIHSGTITGKLNGVMPTVTPTGWRIECTSTSVEACSEYAALQQVRDAAGELDHLDARAAPRRAASLSTLPCWAVITSASSWRRSG